MATSEITMKIRVTSDGFTPGFNCNRRIADLLRVPVEDEVPDYCARPDLTEEILQKRVGSVETLPQPCGAVMVVFAHLDALCVAVAPLREHALASALLCSLEEGPKL